MKLKNTLLRLFILFFLGSLYFCALSPSTLWAQNNEDELFLVSQKAFEDGFYDVAIRYINQLLEQFPQTDKSVQANLLLGQCYFFKTQYLKAYDVFSKLLKYQEFKDATFYWLGETYLKGSDYSKAEEQYKKIIELYPNSIYLPQAYYSLGWVYFETNQYEKAKETFLELIKYFPTNQLAEDTYFKIAECEFNLQDYKNAVGRFQEYNQIYPNSTRHAESYFFIAESFYYLEDPLTAITYYAKSADKAYDSKLSLMSKVSMGWAYLKIGKHDLAKKSFEEALELSKQKGIMSDDVFLGLANLYSETQEYEKAREAYDSLIINFPNSKRIVEALLGKANIQYLLKDYPAAINTYQELINKYAKDKEYAEVIEKTYFGLAWSYLKNKNIDLSIKTFEEIKNKTDNKTVKISALTQIGDAYQDIEDFEKAIEIYDRLLKDFPESIYTDYVQYRQGIALLKMDRTEAATISFQALQENFPQSKYLNDVKYYLAVSNFKEEDWAKAKANIETFISSLTENNEFLAEAHYILALSNFNLNNFQEALKEFKYVADNYPGQSSLIKNSELNIAKTYYKLNNSKEALKQFRLLLFKYPKTNIAQESLSWLGDHYLEMGDYDNAINYYLELINTFPNSDKAEEVYYQLGQTYQAKKEFDKAISAYKNIKNAGSEIYAKGQLAIGEILSKEFDSESAIKTYEDIVLTAPELKKDVYAKIAEAYKRQNNYDKAIESYSESLKSKKGQSKTSDAELQFSIGDIQELKNNPELALEEYLKIPYLYPQEKGWVTKAYLRIARIFEDEESWEKAKEIYNKIIAINGNESQYAQERILWIDNNALPF